MTFHIFGGYSGHETRPTFEAACEVANRWEAAGVAGVKVVIK